MFVNFLILCFIFVYLKNNISLILFHLCFINNLNTIVVIILYRLAYWLGNVFKSSIIKIKIIFSDLNLQAFLLIKTYDIFHNQCGNYKFVSCQNKLGKRVLKWLAFGVFSEIQLVGILVIGKKNKTWVKTWQLLVLI